MTASTSLKIAVFAPMPSAKVRTVTVAEPSALASIRTAALSLKKGRHAAFGLSANVQSGPIVPQETLSFQL